MNDPKMPEMDEDASSRVTSSRREGLAGEVRSGIVVLFRLLAMVQVFLGLATIVSIGTRLARLSNAAHVPFDSVLFVLLFGACHLIVGLFVFLRPENIRPALLSLIPATACLVAYERWSLSSICGNRGSNPEVLTSVASVVVLWAIIALLAYRAPGPSPRTTLTVRLCLFAALMTAGHVDLMTPADFKIGPPALCTGSMGTL